MSDWRRADLGDAPEPGQIISMVVYDSDGTKVTVYERFQVACVLAPDHIRVYGASLPFLSDERLKPPGKPDNPIGPTMILWRETE